MGFIIISNPQCIALTIVSLDPSAVHMITFVSPTPDELLQAVQSRQHLAVSCLKRQLYQLFRLFIAWVALLDVSTGIIELNNDIRINERMYSRPNDKRYVDCMH